MCIGVVNVFAGFGIAHCFGYFLWEVEHSLQKVRRNYCVSEWSPQICLYLLAVITSKPWLQYSHLIWNLWYINFSVSISSVVWENSTSVIYPSSRVSRSVQGKGMLLLVGMGSAYHSTAWEKGILTNSLGLLTVVVLLFVVLVYKLRSLCSLNKHTLAEIYLQRECLLKFNTRQICWLPLFLFNTVSYHGSSQTLYDWIKAH